MSLSRSRVFPGVCTKAHEGVFQGAPRGGAHTSPPKVTTSGVPGGVSRTATRSTWDTSRTMELRDSSSRRCLSLKRSLLPSKCWRRRCHWQPRNLKYRAYPALDTDPAPCMGGHKDLELSSQKAGAYILCVSPRKDVKTSPHCEKRKEEKRSRPR